MNRKTAHVVFVTFLFTLILFAGISNPTAAYSHTYWQHTSLTPGSWHEAANWTNGIPTTTTTNARIDNGGTAQITADAVSYRLYLGYHDSGAVEQAGGTNTIENWLYLGYDSYSSGTYNLSGNAILHVNGSMRIGANSGDGRFEWFGGVLNTPAIVLGAKGTLAVGHDINIDDLVSGFLFGGTLSGLDLAELEITNGCTVTHNLDAVVVKSALIGTATGNGMYNLSGTGQLSASYDEYIGYKGTGEFNQSGGINTVENWLYLGYNSGSSGTYNLSGTGQLSAAEEYIGYSGTGGFNQSGGTNTMGYLYVKDNSSYTLSGGTLSISDSAKINGSFHFSDSNGMLNAEGGLINFANAAIDGARSASFNSAENTLTIFPSGFDPTSEFGSYNASGLVHNAGNTLIIHAGEGFAGRGWIGDHVQNRGSIVVSGGVLQFGGGLTISEGGTLDSSSYDFRVDNGQTITIAASGGQLSANREYLYGTGEFNQTGGVNTVSDTLYIRCGTYNLSGTGQLSADREHIDHAGEFNQSGGTNTISSSLGLGYEAHSSGTYNLSGGQLSAYHEFIGFGFNGTGKFNQTGGIHTVDGCLHLARNPDSTGVYHLLAGKLSAAGISTGWGGGYFTDNGSLGGGEILIFGTFSNYSESPELFSMTHTTLTMWGGLETSPAILNMNSGYMGADCAGLVGNFALGTLVFEGSSVASPGFYYRLNSNVYTYGFVLNEGAVLDLNGHNLYYLPLGQTYNGIATTTQCLGGSWYGGDIIPLSGNIIPEPGAIVLLGAGLFGLAGALRRRVLKPQMDTDKR